MGSPVCLLVARDVSSALMGGVVGVRWVWEGAGREHEAGGSVLTVTISEAVRDTCSAGSSEYCHFAVYSKHTTYTETASQVQPNHIQWIMRNANTDTQCNMYTCKITDMHT